MEPDDSPWWVHAVAWGFTLGPLIAFGIWLALS